MKPCHNRGRSFACQKKDKKQLYFKRKKKGKKKGKGGETPLPIVCKRKGGGGRLPFLLERRKGRHDVIGGRRKAPRFVPKGENTDFHFPKRGEGKRGDITWVTSWTVF